MKKILNYLQRKSIKSCEPLSLAHNFSWTFLSNIIYGFCQWGILIMLAKLGTPEMVGRFTLGLALVTPIILFTNLHLRAVQATDAKIQYSFSDYLHLRFITTSIALLVIILLTFGGGYQGQKGLVILLLGLTKGFESISDIFYGRLQQHERMDNVAKSIIIKSLLSLIALSLGLYLTKNLIWAVLGLTAATAISLIFYDIPHNYCLNTIISQEKIITRQNQIKEINQNYPQTSKWQTLLKLAWLSLPVGLLMMLMSLSGNIPRYVIEKYLGQRELGIFSAMAYLPTAGIMIVSALGQSALPRLAKYYELGNKVAFKKLINKLIYIALFLGLCGLFVVTVAGKQILTLVYKSEYAEQTNVLILLMFMASITYIASFLGYGITGARYFKSSLLISIIMFCITCSTSFWLIPLYKLQGAAIVLIINVIVQLLGSSIILFIAINKLNKAEEFSSL